MRLLKLIETLNEVRIDNKNGWGNVPFNQNVDYMGLRAHMKPSRFLELAHEIKEPLSTGDIETHIRSGGAIGAPFLMVNIPEEWFDGDMTKLARIRGHEGRNRMIAIRRIEGDIPVETHLFFSGGVRNRHLTPEIIDRLNMDVISQRGDLVRGPWFSRSESLSEETEETDDAMRILIKNVKECFADWNPTEALDYMIKGGWTVNDSPELKAIVDANMDQLARKLVQELTVGDSDPEFMAADRAGVEAIGVKIPDEKITKHLKPYEKQLIGKLSNMIRRKGLWDTVEVAAELSDLGLSIKVPDLVDLKNPGMKHWFIKNMLTGMKGKRASKVGRMIKMLRQNGVDWPEFAAFEKSLSGMKGSITELNDPEQTPNLDERRRNPEMNPRRSTPEILRDYLRRYGEGQAYVHFSMMEKVGINPQSHNMFGPHGVYGYPLENSFAVLKDPLLKKRARYANILIPSSNARILDLDTVPLSRMKELLAKAVAFHKKKIKDKQDAYAAYSDVLDVKTAYMGIERLLSNYSRRRNLRLSVIENVFFRSQGYDAIRDTGQIMNDNPNQIVFLVPSAYRVVDRIPLRLEADHRLSKDGDTNSGVANAAFEKSLPAMKEAITVNLSKDPEYFGADVDDDDQDDYPIVQIPMDKLIGFEPDDKMLSPKSKANMEKMIRLIKAGKGNSLPPILVRRYRRGYQVLDGHHRYHAYKTINAKTIPAVIIPPENITGDIDESFRSNNAQREADDARTFSLRMTSTSVGHALEFADDSKSLYHKTPELDKELDIFKTRILDWLDKTIKDNMQEGVVAYNLVRRVAPWGWTELRTWWDDRKADILRTLLTMVQERRFDAVYNLIMLHLRKKLGLKWPELDVIVNSCLTEIRRRSISNEGVEEAWSNKYKKSINCSNPKGFSQKAHCAARRKRAKGGSTKSKPVREAQADRMQAIRDYLNQAMDYDQKNTEQSAREALQNRVWPFITKNIDIILSDKGDKGNGDYPTAAFAAWLLVQHMDAFPARQQEFLLHLEKTIPNHPKLRFLRDRVAVNKEIVRLWKSNPDSYLDKNGKKLNNPTVDVRDPSRFDDASKKAVSREEALDSAKQANNTLLVQAVTNTNALTQPSFTQVSENFTGDQKRQHLNFDNLYGKAFRITDAEGDPNRPGFSIVTPLNGNAWADWKERPQFKSIVKQRLNDPNFLGDHKYQQIIDAMTGRSFDTNRHTDIKENFADGKGPGRPGDSRRHGIPKNATLAQLDKIGKGSGRKAQLARWQANMRRGRKKSVNEQKPNDHWVRYSKTLKDYLSKDDILDMLADLNAAVEDYGLTARPDITDAIEHNKDNIMRWMLSLLKRRPVEIADRLLSPYMRAFSKLGIDWPELQVIKNSISPKSGRSLRETIAPHGDPQNELKMLQAGTKPAALVNPWEFDKLYRPIIDGMGWEVIEYEIEGFDGHRFYVVAQPGEKARAQRIVQLVQYANRLVTAGGRVGPDYHRELGFLLGYKQADIDHFLRNMYGDEHVAKVAEGDANSKTDGDQNVGAALTVFDIDETLFHTAAKILVIKDGEVVKELDNRQFNTYVLQDGESFDFKQFTDAQFFHDTSIPIDTMWKRAKSTLDSIGRRPGSRVIIVTARSDFDDKEKFLNTFRKHGLDIDKIHVHRAGNLNMPSAEAKKKIIGQYLATKQFDMVRLFDDAESNLRSFLSLKDEFPEIKFNAYMVLDDGNIREYRMRDA